MTGGWSLTKNTNTHTHSFKCFQVLILRCDHTHTHTHALSPKGCVSSAGCDTQLNGRSDLCGCCSHQMFFVRTHFLDLGWISIFFFFFCRLLSDLIACRELRSLFLTPVALLTFYLSHFLCEQNRQIAPAPP